MAQKFPGSGAKNASFYQDRLGTNIGKVEKRGAFFAGKLLTAAHGVVRLVAPVKTPRGRQSQISAARGMDDGRHSRQRAAAGGRRQSEQASATAAAGIH